MDVLIPGKPASVVDLLTLAPLGEDRFASRCNEENRGGEIFGGQYLGQSLRAALATAPGFVPQAMSCTFLRAARAADSIEWVVERTRQGRRFAHRQVRATQAGRAVFRAEIALHVPEDGLPAHQQAMPEVPGPAGLRSIAELFRARSGPVAEAIASRIEASLSEVRLLDEEIGVVRPADRPALRAWVRAMVPEDAEPALQYAALAYMSDNLAPSASRIIHAPSLWDQDLVTLSLSHVISFHALPRVQDWLLYDLTSQFAGGGIGSNRNLIFGADGRLVASVTQDAMLRPA